MRFDIDRLQAFYGSALGGMSHDMLAKRVAALWPHADGLDVLGLGHADALLEPYRAGARRVISAAPDEQGAERWPADGKGLGKRCTSPHYPRRGRGFSPKLSTSRGCYPKCDQQTDFSTVSPNSRGQWDQWLL